MGLVRRLRCMDRGTSHHTGLGQAIIRCASTWRRTSPKSPLSGLALTCVCTVSNMYAGIVSFYVKLCTVEHIAQRFGLQILEAVDV